MQKYNILVKEHNTDYLTDESLSWHPKLGIHAANVAPEFGVIESRALVDILSHNSLNKEKEKVLQCWYGSKKWAKWFPRTQTTDYDKAVLAGHYNFANEDFVKIKENISSQLKNINLNEYLKNEVKEGS